MRTLPINNVSSYQSELLLETVTIPSGSKTSVFKSLVSKLVLGGVPPATLVFWSDTTAKEINRTSKAKYQSCQRHNLFPYA